jgi:hypothetical protein
MFARVDETRIVVMEAQPTQAIRARSALATQRCTYGPSIIDAWTASHDDGTTDIDWFLSTWNPYQVVLMKTTFRP